MSGHDWWGVAGMLGLATFDMWIFTSIGSYFLRLVRPNADLSPLRAVRAELRPFALPGLLLSYAVSAFAEHGLGMWGCIGLALNLFNWWYWRREDKDDDDRWKRRKKKLAEKVAEVGGKLVLVPAGSPP